VDKLLALRGGAEAVALWAQRSSLMEVVSGVALAGIGAGLSVLVAQSGSAERIASWIPLFALYAMRRTRAIAVGELLSLPLYAGLTYSAIRRRR
jgi:hypothetical protein